MIINPNNHRFLLIFLAGIALLTGLWAGIARMGWFLPVPNSQFVVVHGPLMVVGFLGTLIGLERAVALQRWWAYAVPTCAGLGAIGALMALPVQVSASLAALASLFLIAVFITLYRQYPSEHFIIMALSALAWFVGNALWFTDAAVFTIVPWWVGFLVLMIAGERLELSRLRQPSALVRHGFHGCIALVVIGLACSFFDFFTAIRISGFGFLGLAAWLLRYDLAWQSARQPGLPRFMATSLIAGYVWLAMGGILWMVFAQFFSAGPRYDAMLHAIFLGFVFSMIFAHAPIILPTITGLSLPFQNIFYLHAALLHVSLLLRIVGDLSPSASLQQWAGLLNAGAILLFLVNNVRAVRLGARVGSIRKS
ncbi:MAG TPA: hypothetical protein VF089_16860 [Candidatus Binatia bacterium]